MTTSITTIKLGRGSNCDICIKDDTVSRVHATLEFNGDGTIVLTDQESGNGTFVRSDENWQPIRTAVVRHEDELRFGAHIAKLSDLLELVPLVAMGGVQLKGRMDGLNRSRSGVVEIVESRELMNRPRRNPETGEIEETD